MHCENDENRWMARVTTKRYDGEKENKKTKAL